MENVRSWLIDRQRSLSNLGLIIMEGRDIGTVIFPDARYKFFITASPEVRARRRLAQSGETPEGSTVASVAKEIAARDEMDSKRKIAPLKKADDAIFVDSSEMSVEEVVNFIASFVK
jgi:cytidylate kinase